jgi:hypothetical protein
MRTHLVKFVAAAASSVLAAGAFAGPNLVTNGSFETGDLTGWTQTGTPIVYSASNPQQNPISVITYGPGTNYPTGAYGEAVNAPADATLSPDAAGSHGAYFVDDHAVNQGLSQSVFLLAGNYEIGFDVYAPANGYANANDARFTASIANVMLANYMVSTKPETTWTNYEADATVLTSGFYDVSFLFNTPGLGVAKDVVVDRVFVLAGGNGGTVVVPEPDTIALLGIAAMGLVATRFRRKKA